MAKYWIANNPNSQVTDAEAQKLEELSATTVTLAELNKAADASVIAPATITATAAVSSTARCIKVAHNSVVIAITGSSGVALAGQTMFITNTSASGTAAHTVTLSAGTYDGTNNTATLNAPGETLHVWFDSAGAGTVIANVGSVGLSSV
tara:strand:+ start:24 stop:470 length:447 start_codon:yes stop_codon:yes gene_type:complete